MSALDELLERPPVILDGAIGTMLQELGLPPGVPPETWNIERPDEVRSLAEAYARAGAAIVTTNTFGANRARLEEYSLDDRLERINSEGARLAAEGVGGGALVAGSVGPSGLCTGMDPPAESRLEGLFSEQCHSLAGAGVDLLVLETFYDIAEFRCALRAASGCGLPFIAMMTFQETPRGFFTMMGVTPARALDEARSHGAAAAGANCTLGSDAMLRLTVEMASLGPQPLAVSPNAGRPELEGGRTVYRQGPADFAADVARAQEAGAALVGGCCGTTPGFVRAVSSALAGRSGNR